MASGTQTRSKGAIIKDHLELGGGSEVAPKVDKSKLAHGLFYEGITGKGYCSWGWFEDTVLNSYFGFSTEKKGSIWNGFNKEMRTQIRSFSWKEGTAGENLYLPNTCRHNNEYLYTIDHRVILPGRFFPMPSKSFLKEHGEEDSLNLDAQTASQYENLRKFQTQINERFEAFAPYGYSHFNKGIIRNFVFSADFLMKHFAKINTLESGLNSFWQSVSSIYGGFWNFEIKQSGSDTGRIQVVDVNSTENSAKDNVVFPIIKNKSTEEEYRNVGYDPDKVDPSRTWEFSVNSKDSIINDFSVDVTLDSKLVTQAIYHTNKDTFEVGSSGMNAPESLGIEALATLHNAHMTQEKVDEYHNQKELDDQILKKITTPYLKGMMSYNDGGIVTDELGKRWVDGQLELVKWHTIDMVTKEITTARENANQLIKAKKWKKGMSWVKMTDAKKFLVYDINGTMHKPLQRGMLYYINKSTTAKKQVDPLVPFTISFTLQGIAGITIGNMFAIDYLPDMYRRFALFQVSKVSHEIGTEGWKTSVEAIMRIDMDSLLGDAKYSKVLPGEEEVIPEWLESAEQRDFLDAIGAQLALEADIAESGWWSRFFRTMPDEVLLVPAEEAGKLLVKLKEIEDELVVLHSRAGAHTIDQLRKIYTINMYVKMSDIRDMSTLQGPGLEFAADVLGLDILNHVNDLSSKALSIRKQIFDENDSEGKPLVYPQSDSATKALTEKTTYTPREAYSQYMDIDKSIGGLKKSGFSEEINPTKLGKAERSLAKRFTNERWYGKI